MKALDADLRVTCAGSQGDGGRQIAEVSSYLMEQAGKYLDYVSVHNYYLPRADQLPNFDYLTAITKSEAPEVNMTIVTESLRKAGFDRIKIAFDEWNLRAWQHPGFPRDVVENYDAPAIRELVERRRKQNDLASQYTMADALFAASFLNACLRHAGAGEHGHDCPPREYARAAVRSSQRDSSNARISTPWRCMRICSSHESPLAR